MTPSESSPATRSVALGYVILYVKDVAASLDFYERAFGLSRKFYADDKGTKAYGELETGAARLAFAGLDLVQELFNQDLTTAAPDKPPLGMEVALVTTEVAAMYVHAIKAGATAVLPPTVKPWGQTVAYVRDNNGFLVEICTPMA